MNISDLMTELTRLWPDYFRSEATADAWAGQYRNVLRQFGGKPLQIAWDATMATWTKSTPPKPADIREHCRAPAAKAQQAEETGGYKPIPRSDLMHVSRETLTSEYREALWHANYYRMHRHGKSYRQDGTVAATYPELLAKWRDRADFIARMMGGAPHDWSDPPPAPKPPFRPSAKAIGAQMPRLLEPAA